MLLNTSPFPAATRKLISLNIWEGHMCDDILNLLKTKDDIDIFCLQEVYSNAPKSISTCNNIVTLDIFERIQDALPKHIGYFSPVVNEYYGNAIFVNKNITVSGEGKEEIYLNPQYNGVGPAHNRALQWLKCHVGAQIFYVANIHGLWNGKGKADSPERLEQSQKIRNFVESLRHPILLCGDFNLRPDTESIKIVEQGFNNLISQNNIKSTRTKLYLKDEKHADYIFVSVDIEVALFRVLPDVVSDHAPLLLEFAF